MEFAHLFATGMMSKGAATDDLSEAQLQQYCENQDLSQVGSLKIVVDVVQQDLSCLGSHLSNLRHLNLSGSSIHWVRDLGTSFNVLEVLWLCRCQLQDLQGIGAMQSLKELYVAFNYVAETSPLHWHESLEILDMEGNNLEDFNDLLELGTCESLRDLTICYNPVCAAEDFSKQALLQALPQLDVLDDIGTEVCNDAKNDTDFGLHCLYASLHMLDEAVGVDVSEPSSEAEDEEELTQLANSSAYVPCTQSAMLASMAVPEDWSRASALLVDDPSEYELVTEAVKQLQSGRDRRLVDNDDAALDKSAVQSPSAGPPSGFQFRLAHRRSNSEKSSNEGASDLTRGDCLAGNPMAVARQNRLQKNASHHGSPSMDIRSLLRFYQTYDQPICLPQEVFEERCLQVEQQRPCTPDVRVRAIRDAQPITCISKVKRQETSQPFASEETLNVSSKDEQTSQLLHRDSFDVTPPQLTKPVDCLTSKLAPIPPKTPCGKSSSFRRIRDTQINVAYKTEGCDMITRTKETTQDASTASFRRRHPMRDISTNEEPEIREANNTKLMKNDKTSIDKITYPKEVATVEPTSAEAEMMMSMHQLVQGAPRFY